MRHSSELLYLLAALALGGCVSEEKLPPTSTNSSPAPREEFRQAFRMENEELGDRALLDVALVQAPLGDPFLDRQVWSGADHMIFSLEKRELLEANGFRIGLLVGSPPEGITNLLQSERTCVERHGRVTPSGMTVNQALLTGNEPVACQVRHLNRVENLRLERPSFSLDLTPKRLTNATVRLNIAPRVEGGDKIVTYKPVPEESKWTLDTRRAGQLLSELAVDIDLLPNQLLLVGCRSEHEDSVGYCSFVRLDGPEPMQRLLVVRHLKASTKSLP